MDPLEGIDWRAVEDEALAHLRALLKLDTTNPPGNEAIAARYVGEALRADGIEPTVVEAAPGRASVVGRLPRSEGAAGTPDPDGLLLTSHTDVVPADAARWRHAPFSADEAEGCIWGRGALDMKSMTAMSLAIVQLAKRRGVKLARDLVLAAVADEEAGGDFGMSFLVDRHPDLVRAGWALNELGGFTLHLGGARFYPVQVAEKGIVWFRMRARGEPGHGSVPNPESAVVALSRAVSRMGKRALPLHVTSVTRAFVEEVAAELPFPKSLVFRQVLSPALSDAILPRAIPDPARRRAFSATLRNTATPTGLSAGVKTNVNVIPPEATAVVDGRVLPGFTSNDLLKELREVAGNGIEIEVIKSLPPNEVPFDTPLFDLIRKVVPAHDPGSKVVPYLISGYTDANHLARIGVRTYGFAPVRLDPDMPFFSLYHANDERVPVDGFRFGVRVLGEVVLRFCAA